MKPVTRKRYTAEFKAQAVGHVNLGKLVSSSARDLEIGEGNLYKRVRNVSQSGQLGSRGTRAVGEEPGVDELPRLRREILTLKLENDILKKAAVILGTRLQPSAAR